jgi:rhomboid protease GluP
VNENPGAPTPVPESPRPEGTVYPPQAPAPQTLRIPFPSVPPFVTYTLLGICVLVYLAQLATQQWLGYDWPLVWGVKWNEGILRGELWRLFTPMFLHGSIYHILFNMYALANLGPGLERHYGHQRFLALFVLGGFAGNVVSFLLSSSPSLGSSTAIFGLLGAEGVLLYHNKRMFGGMAQRALSNVVMIAVINLLIGMSPGIDNWGHVGGLIGGTLFAWLGGPLLQLEGMFPTLSITDRREPGQVWLAGFVVGSIFAFLAGAGIVLKG